MPLAIAAIAALILAGRASHDVRPAAMGDGQPRAAAASSESAGRTAGLASASMTALMATLPAPPHPTPSSVAADSVKVNQFIEYDATAKAVSIKLIAALNSAQGGFNFNGGSSGDQTITVPAGWHVHFDVRNNDAIPHSAIVIKNQTPIPNAPDQAAFPEAYTTHLTDGLPPQTGHDTMDFTASTPGAYLIACGVPGHAPSGMYIRFVVSASATAPTNTGTIASG